MPKSTYLEALVKVNSKVAMEMLVTLTAASLSGTPELNGHGAVKIATEAAEKIIAATFSDELDRNG